MIIKIMYWRGLSIKLISRGLQMSQMSQKMLIINYLIVLVTRSPRLSGLARSLTEEKQWAAERTQLGWIRVPVQLPPDNRIQYTTRLEIRELRIEMFLNCFQQKNPTISHYRNCWNKHLLFCSCDVVSRVGVRE